MKSKMHSARAERALIGDLTEDGAVPMGPDYANYGGQAMPPYGGLLDVGPGSFSEGDLHSVMGGLDGSLLHQIPDESGALVMKGEPSYRGTLKPAPSFALAGRPSFPGLTKPSGIIAARTTLARAGVGSKGSQDSLMATASELAALNRLGERARGVIPGTDKLSFVTCQTGTLHQVDGLREGTGADAFGIRQLLINQYFARPYKAYYTTATPASGTAINVKGSVPANVNVPVVAIAIMIASPELTAQRVKVMGFELAIGVAGVQTQAFYKAQVSYDENGVCKLIYIPAQQVDGEYFPTGLTVRDDTVLANDLDLFINVTGTNGTDDTVTVALLGPAHGYTRNLFSRLG